MKILRIYLLFVFALTIPGVTLASMHYVRDGATGNGDGSDWTNAYDSLPEKLVRGDTYYIADGTYPGYAFDDAQSGSAYIYIKKATDADHGSETGWQSSFGDGQAEFNPITFSTGYYEIDGQIGGGAGNWDTGYGIRVREKNNASSKLARFNAAVTNLLFRHIDFSYDYNDQFTSFPVGAPPIATSQDAVYSLYSASDITFSYCRFNRAGRTALLTRGAWRNILIEYTYFRDNTIGAYPQHGEIWSANHATGNLTNITFRYNNVRNFSSTGGLIMSGGDGIFIYGNIWNKSSGGANGAIGNWTSEALTKNVYIYNNSFVEMDATLGYGNTSEWEAYNNIFYANSRASFRNCAHDYSYSDVNFGEPNGQVIGEDPFINRAIQNFGLSSATNPGMVLSPPFNKDMVGYTRGGDGVWDRGALEYVSGASLPLPVPSLPAPSNLRTTD